MNLYNYIDDYGIYSFYEKPFNELDAAIFSFLSYVDYSSAVKNNKVLLKNAGRILFGVNSSKKRKDIIAIREATKMLNYIKDVKRYKDCLLYNYIYEANDDIQFSAICIEYMQGEVYVSYEGTDQMISGWKEDLLLSYEFPTLSHVKAINYLNRHFTFSNKKLIIGGHSKGGNFALVAAMCCNFLVQKKIVKVYSHDGPGLLEKEFKSKRFKKIENKYVHYIPNDSIVGILLNNSNSIVVNSTVRGPLAHDILFWKVDKDKFVKDKLTPFSQGLQSGINKFLDNHSQVELELVINDLSLLCKRANIDSLLDFKEDNMNIIKLLNESKRLSKTSRKILYELIDVIIHAIGNEKYVNFKEFVKKFRVDVKLD